MILLAGVIPITTSARQVAAIRYDNASHVSIPDGSSVESLVYVDGVGSPILDVRVSLQVFHTLDADLDVSLIGPDGTTIDLTSDNGGSGGNYGTACTPDGSRTTLDDAAPTAITAGSAPFIGSFRPEQALSAFDGKTGAGAANGIWRLRIADDTAGNTGTLQCWSLFITASVTAPTAVDDAYSTPINTPLVVPAPGVLANDLPNGGGPMTAAAVSQPTHGFLTFNSDGSFTYTPSSNYTGPDTFAYRAFNGVGAVGSNVAFVDLTVTPPPPTAMDDTYATPFQTPLNVPAPGVLGNDINPVPSSSMTAGLIANVAHGTLTFNSNGSFAYTPAAGYFGSDSFTYSAINVGGAGNAATVFLTVGGPTNAQPPTGLYTSSVVGNRVTLRWTPPTAGATPTQYVLEGGLAPGEVLASFPTGSPYPIFTFVAPTGSFHVRMHSLAGTDRSAASNEILLHVNVPVAPSTPADLLSLVDGSTLNLAWRNTFAGGAPSGMVLEVTGAFAGAFALGPGDTFAFAGVPAGTYTLRLSAINAGGVSAPSNPVTVTFPGPCTALARPNTPIGMLAYKIGNTIFVIWDPAASGPAPTAYVLNVTGAFVGSFPTTGRALSSAAAPGSYGVSVVANNACGTSAPTPVQTVTIP